MAMRPISFLLRRGRLVLVAALASLALAACVSPYPGGSYGNGPYYPGGGQQYANEVVGTVQYVDRSRVVLTLDGNYGNRGREATVYYDSRTQLYYRGQRYPVDGLERGDVVRASVIDSGNRLYANSMEVVRNIRESGGYYPGSGYPGNNYGQYEQLRGRVAWVDQRGQIIRLDAGSYGQTIDIRYDSRTRVEWRGKYYPARDLDPGDVIRIEASRSGSSWYAERITMEVNAGR